jgi:tetratricopeptide (TPR) repeat protein
MPNPFSSPVLLVALLVGGILASGLGLWLFLGPLKIARLLYHFAWGFYQRDQYKPALFLLEQAFKLDPSFPAITYTIGVIHLDLGHLGLAKDALYIALLQNTEDPLCLYHLGVLEYQEEHYALAIEHWVKTIQYSSNPDADIYYYLGLAYEALEEWQTAYEVYQQGLEMLPGNSDLLAQLSIICIQLNRLGNARFYVEEALALPVPPVDAIHVKALLEVEAGRLEEAYTYAEEAVKQEPENPEYLNTLAVLGTILEVDDQEAVLKHLIKASTLCDKGQEAVLYNCAIAFGVRNQNSDAKSTLRKLSKTKLPSDIRASANQARLILKKQERNALENVETKEEELTESVV